MDELALEEVVADAHAQPLPELTHRRAKLPWLPRKVDAIVGMRRSGKTSLIEGERQARRSAARVRMVRA